MERHVRKAAAALAKVIPDAFDGDAHALLMAIYKDPAQPMDMRIAAAGKAIRYEKPALAQIEMHSEANVIHEIRDAGQNHQHHDHA